MLKQTPKPEPAKEEEKRHPIPAFIRDMLNRHVLLPGESREEFLLVFESYAFGAGMVPDTDQEYVLAYLATKCGWELIRLERTKIKVLKHMGRSAAEVVYRRSFVALADAADAKATPDSVRKWTQHYFADPSYRKEFAAKLEATGYGADAIETEAYLLGLPSIVQIERLIAGAEKRLLTVLKQLDALRHPRARLFRKAARGQK